MQRTTGHAMRNIALRFLFIRPTSQRCWINQFVEQAFVPAMFGRQECLPHDSNQCLYIKKRRHYRHALAKFERTSVPGRNSGNAC